MVDVEKIYYISRPLMTRLESFLWMHFFPSIALSSIHVPIKSNQFSYIWRRRASLQHNAATTEYKYIHV